MSESRRLEDTRKGVIASVCKDPSVGTGMSIDTWEASQSKFVE